MLATFAILAPPAAAVTRSFSVYAVATNEVYVNNTDSLTLGVANNPFGKPTGSAAKIGSESTNGPFPGDEGIYSFLLYANKSLHAKVGSALYTCQYYFDKNGFCDVTIQLNNGILIGAGIFNFNTRGYALAITGGEGNFTAASGDVEASPSGPQAQRLAFALKQP